MKIPVANSPRAGSGYVSGKDLLSMIRVFNEGSTGDSILFLSEEDHRVPDKLVLTSDGPDFKGYVTLVDDPMVKVIIENRDDLIAFFRGLVMVSARRWTSV